MAPGKFHLINQWLKDHRVPVTHADRKLLMRHSSLLRIPKGSVMMAQGKKVTDLYFINKGMVRLHSLVAGEDTTIDFIPEHEFASTVIYILNQHPSVYALDALTEVTALHWTREDVLYLREKVSCAAALETALQLRLLTWIQERELDVLNLTPEQRYEKLFDTYPEVVQQVPLRYIASYLGIHQDSLSRIRNKRARRS